MCECAAESVLQVFTECKFAQELWAWLGSIFCIKMDLSSILSLFSVCNRSWSSQASDVVLAAIINVLYCLWFCRNRIRFDNRRIQIQGAKIMIIASVALTGNLSSGSTSSSMQEFGILKALMLLLGLVWLQ